MIAETGWHTSGTCVAYNDCASTYSAGDAATYYEDLYAYVQTNKIPLLAFQPFDQRTKLCDPAGRPPPPWPRRTTAIFTNFCQLKGGNQALLPPAGPGSPGPNLAAFTALLDDDAIARRQVVPPPNAGRRDRRRQRRHLRAQHQHRVHRRLCVRRPCPGPRQVSARPRRPANRCVCGYCANDTTIGCNPGRSRQRPGLRRVQARRQLLRRRPAGPLRCERQLRCRSSFLHRRVSERPGLQWRPARRSPTPASVGSRRERVRVLRRHGAGHAARAAIRTRPTRRRGSPSTYSKGDFQFRKERTLLPEVVLASQRLRGDARSGAMPSSDRDGRSGSSTLPIPRSALRGRARSNTVSALNVSNPLQPSLTWSSNWAACSYQVGGVIASNRHPYRVSARIPGLHPQLAASGPLLRRPRDRTRVPLRRRPRADHRDLQGRQRHGSERGSRRMTAGASGSAAVQCARAPPARPGVRDRRRPARRGGGRRRAEPAAGWQPRCCRSPLRARDGSTPTRPTYQTAAGVRPNVSVQVEKPDASTGLMTFTIAVDRDSMPRRPLRAARAGRRSPGAHQLHPRRRLRSAARRRRHAALAVPEQRASGCREPARMSARVRPPVEWLGETPVRTPINVRQARRLNLFDVALNRVH